MGQGQDSQKKSQFRRLQGALHGHHGSGVPLKVGGTATRGTAGLNHLLDSKGRQQRSQGHTADNGGNDNVAVSPSAARAAAGLTLNNRTTINLAAAAAVERGDKKDNKEVSSGSIKNSVLRLKRTTRSRSRPRRSKCWSQGGSCSYGA